MLTADEHSGFLKSVEQVQQAALNHLSANLNRKYAISFIANLQRGVDQIVQTSIDQGQRLDCKAGCSHCCCVRVETLAPEVFQIANALKKLPPENIAEFTERLRKHAALAQGVSVLDHRIVCPFLIDKLCSIYTVRPAVCRKAHSYAAEKCSTPGAEMPESLVIIMNSEALMKGTANAYAQVGLSASAHELGQAVLLALTDDTAESRWYGGESVFDSVAPNMTEKETR